MGQGLGPGAVPRRLGVLARLPSHPLPRRPVGPRSPLPATPRQRRARACCRFFALEQKSRCLCYSNADLTRADQNGELMRFVEFWHALTGTDPQWLYFDSKLIDYAELSRVNQRKIHFVTIRRRGAAILRRLERRPPRPGRRPSSTRPSAVIKQIRYLDETVRLRGYEGPIRQLAVAGLGRDQPTLFLSNDFEETPRELIIRYAGRNRHRGRPGHQRELLPSRLPGQRGAAERRSRRGVDGDRQRLLPLAGVAAARLREGDAEATVPSLRRDRRDRRGPARTGSTVTFDRRSHNPILREAALDREPVPIPWLGRRRLAFTFR